MKNYSQLFHKIEELLSRQEMVILAIDGNSSAGKSTLGKLLKEKYDGEIIAMDHFFLQLHQRIEARFQEPGGNIDYERFSEEVLEKLKKHTPFFYRPFLCGTFQFGEPILVGKKHLYIIEGAYSTHPIFGKYYDLSLFLSISETEQLERILQRNGATCLEYFVKKWIPMETLYFETYDIKKRCDLNL